MDKPDARERELIETRDRSIAALRSVADHRRVERLARQIHASMQGENQADAFLAQIKVLGVWLRTMTLSEQLTAISMITHLVMREIMGDDPHTDA